MQSKIRSDDTIAAIATPVGEGAISIVRISGQDAIDLGDRIFRGRTPLSLAAGYTVHHGYIHEADGHEVDEVLMTVFRTPHSYTGEDCLEIGCHGGLVTSSRVLEVVLRHGARQADPGEFTKRAFLNGKLDLSQAEAVADLVSARSLRAQEQSLGQLQGSLRNRIESLKVEMLEVCSLLEIDLDFSDEGISVVSTDEIRRRLDGCLSALNRLLSSYEAGKIIRDGVRVVLAGPPNVGKSSLFNALLKQDRSIVSELPGTTRDYIEEGISISGILFLLVDTAGARETSDSAELQGVARSRKLLRTSDITVAVVDSVNSVDRDFFDRWLGETSPERVILAFNKVDLRESVERPIGFPQFPGRSEVFVSAKTGFGLEELRSALIASVAGSGPSGDFDVTITNKRHVETLERVKEALEQALASADRNLTNDFIAMDVRSAIGALSEITGEITSEDVLNGIFARFCVGK